MTRVRDILIEIDRLNGRTHFERVSNDCHQESTALENATGLPLIMKCARSVIKDKIRGVWRGDAHEIDLHIDVDVVTAHRFT